MMRGLALEQLAKMRYPEAKHEFVLELRKYVPQQVNERRAFIYERRRCNKLQTRLEEDGENIHEVVRTLAIAGCSQHIR